MYDVEEVRKLERDGGSGAGCNWKVVGSGDGISFGSSRD